MAYLWRVEGKSCSRISAKTLDSVTSPQNQKGNIRKLRAGDSQQLRALLTPLGRKRQHCPLETDCSTPPRVSGHEKNVLEDTGTLKMNIIMQMGLSLLLFLSWDNTLGGFLLRHLKKQHMRGSIFPVLVSSPFNKVQTLRASSSSWRYFQFPRTPCTITVGNDFF